MGDLGGPAPIGAVVARDKRFDVLVGHWLFVDRGSTRSESAHVCVHDSVKFTFTQYQRRPGDGSYESLPASFLRSRLPFVPPIYPLCSLRMRRRETQCETYASSLRTASFTVKVFDCYNAIGFLPRPS